MKIGVVGLGYVGLVTAVVLAAHGNDVIAVDVDQRKITGLKNGKLPIYEPGLKELFDSVESRISFSWDYGDISGCDAVFIATPTPTVNGYIDLSYVYRAAELVAENNKNCVLVIKSTVIPGTAREVIRRTGLRVVSNPEFTREGHAVADTEKPDRIVLGGTDTHLAREIWAFTNSPVIETTNENAEIIKYASNSFLAVKISFINEIANLCEKIPGSDVEVVAKGMGMDPRIGEKFLKAGLGFGGSCFPKDTLALVAFARNLGLSMNIVEAAIEVNSKRVDHAVSIIDDEMKHLNLRKVCVLGVAFKDNTDDIRESKAIEVINRLIEKGYDVSFYDPVVKNAGNGAKSCKSISECISRAEAVAITAEWEEFKTVQEIGLSKPVFDLKRLLDKDNFRYYRGVGLWHELEK